MTALSDIPCPICGVADRHTHSDREIFAWVKDAARWMKDAAKRISTLEALIADAPHSDSCCLEYVTVGAVDRDKTRPYCNCWKSRALDTGAKG